MPSLRLKIQYGKNLGMIMSPTELLENYLFGIPLCSNDGRKMSMSAIAKHILSAQSIVENLFSIKLTKQVIEETRDYIREEFMSWGYIRTMYPIAFVDNLEGWINDVCQLTYPREWLSIKRIESVAVYRNIYLIPNTGTKEGAHISTTVSALTLVGSVRHTFLTIGVQDTLLDGIRYLMICSISLLRLLL